MSSNTSESNSIKVNCCNHRSKSKRKYYNRMKKIWESMEKESKTPIDQKDLDQLRFHIKNMFQGMNEHKYVSFGYIHKNSVRERGILLFWSFKIGQISDVVLKKILLLSEEHVIYISQNSFTRPRRLSECAYASHCFILDLDYYTIDKYKHLTPEQMMAILRFDGMFDFIKPSYSFASGHGLALAFHFSNILPVGLNKRVASLRSHLANYIIKAYAEYGADPSGKDLARINKVPGSITQNKSKNQANIIDHTRLVSHISADGFTNSREFLAAIDQNLGEWESFYDEVGFWSHGDPLPADITYPKSPACTLSGNYSAEKVYILDFDQIADKPLHTHSVDELIAHYLPETKQQYLNRLKKEDQAKRVKWSKKDRKPKVNVTKTLQTLAFLRVQDLFTLCIERAKKGLRQYRQSALFIAANMLAAQYDYHEMYDLNGALKIGEIRDVLLRLNETFTIPHSELFVESIINDLVRKFNQAIKEEQTEDSKETGKHDHRFYHFTSDTIITEMRITSEEEKIMKVTISSDEKHFRYLARKQREKEVRAAVKEQKIMERLYAIKTYLKELKTVKQIAKLMDLSTRTIDRLKAKLKEVSEFIIDSFMANFKREAEKETSISNNSVLKDQILSYDPNQISLLDLLPDIKSEYQEVTIHRNGILSALKFKSGPPINGTEIA